MSFSRWWTERVAAIGDVVPLPLLLLLVLLATGLAALAWYHFPAWVPRRLPRWRFRRRPRLRSTRAESAPAEAESPPTPTAPRPAKVGTLITLADRLATEGRYAESVRARLRGMLGELVERRILEHQPAMTVAELTAAAARLRPEVAPPLTAAGQLFSDLWYGQRPAHAEHDIRMRAYLAELRRALDAGPDPTAATTGRVDDPGGAVP